MRQCYITEGKIEYQDLHTSQTANEGKEPHLGWLTIDKGQHITGVIKEAEETVTISFYGKDVTVPKSTMDNPEIGQVRSFEVLKITDKTIEIRETKNINNNNEDEKIPIIKIDKDTETFLSIKKNTSVHIRREKEVEATINKINEILSQMTDQDYERLEIEGLSVEKLSVDTLYSSLKRIRELKSEIETEQTKQPVELKGSTKSKKNSEELNIKQKLRDANLPITNESIQKVSSAMALSDTVLKVTDQAIAYLIEQKLEPSIKNIYKACYSSNNQSIDSTTKLSKKEWENIEPQVKEVIGKAGYEINDKTIKEAKWMLEHQLPVTEESFTYLNEVQEIKAQYDRKEILDTIVDGMKNGIDPMDVSLKDGQTAKKMENIIAELPYIQVETVVTALKEVEPMKLTIQKLVEVQKRGETTKEVHTTNEIELHKGNEEHPIEAIKAKRQLEEIRLKMTTEAAVKLEKKGIHIETEPLQRVVDSLRELEDNYYKDLLREAEVLPTQDNIEVVRETARSIQQLQYIPNVILGSMSSGKETETITSLLSEGTKVLSDFQKANQAYETLMTVPIREYGDSIQKAFSNLGTILETLNLDNTIYNQRAVKILGYNNMEITEEAIDYVKSFDLQVNALMKDLHPAVTVRLIKEGINPLNIPIEELNTLVQRMKEDMGISNEEKYSVYLRKLEKENGISEEERKTYIGLYRLLYQVEKSDGAAVGAVLKADREVTLNNLLTAIRTTKLGSTDTLINDEFGTLQEINVKGERITDQLNSVFTKEQSTQQIEKESFVSQNGMENRLDCITMMLKEMLNELTPGKLTHIHQSYNTTYAEETAMWGALKDKPIESLYDQFLKVAQDEDHSEAVVKIQELREIYKSSDQAVRFLNDMKIPNTPTNIMLVSHLLSNGESLFKKLQKHSNENSSEKFKIPIKEMLNLSDTLFDKKTMNESYEQIEKQVEDGIETAFLQEKLDLRGVNELNSIRALMTLNKTLAEKEYYQLPIETPNGITNINLTILRGNQEAGKVTVNVYSEGLGKIKADFTLKGDILKGFISCDNKETIQLLKGDSFHFEELTKEDNIIVKQIDFGFHPKDIDTYKRKNMEQEPGDELTTVATEKSLYQIAKNMIQMIKKAESQINKE